MTVKNLLNNINQHNNQAVMAAGKMLSQSESNMSEAQMMEEFSSVLDKIASSLNCSKSLELFNTPITEVDTELKTLKADDTNLRLEEDSADSLKDSERVETVEQVDDSEELKATDESESEEVKTEEVAEAEVLEETTESSENLTLKEEDLEADANESEEEISETVKAETTPANTEAEKIETDAQASQVAGEAVATKQTETPVEDNSETGDAASQKAALVLKDAVKQEAVKEEAPEQIETTATAASATAKPETTIEETEISGSDAIIAEFKALQAQRETDTPKQFDKSENRDLANFLEKEIRNRIKNEKTETPQEILVENLNTELAQSPAASSRTLTPKSNSELLVSLLLKGQQIQERPETKLMAGNGIKGTPAAGAPVTNNASQTGLANRNSTATQQAKALPRNLSTKAMEKVQEALKTAAQAKDGKTISVRLDPPTLGSVKVDVSLKDGALHARIVAESPQVNNMLREKGHDLQQMLRELGLNVDQVTVSFNSEEQSSSQDTGKSFNEESKLALEQEVQGEEDNILVTNSNTSAQIDHWVA